MIIAGVTFELRELARYKTCWQVENSDLKHLITSRYKKAKTIVCQILSSNMFSKCKRMIYQCTLFIIPDTNFIRTWLHFYRFFDFCDDPYKSYLNFFSKSFTASL